MKIRKLVSDISSKVSFLLIKSQSCALAFANAIRNTNLKVKRSQRMLNMRLAFTVCFVLSAIDTVYALDEISNDSSLKKIAETIKGCSNIGDFHEGRAWFCKNEKFGFVDKMGNMIVPAKYDDIADFKEGRAWVANRGEDDQYRCGYID